MSDDTFSRALPERPSFEQLKKQAKELLGSFQEGDDESVALVGHFERNPDPEKFGLQDAQRILARSYGFPSWTQLKERLMVVAIRTGDPDNLAKIIGTSDPTKLFKTKLGDAAATNHAIGREATLLQFASFRNWKGIDTVSLLLDSGAEIDLHSACGLGLVDRINELLAADPSGIHEQVDSYFPLQYAITGSRPESIDCLMARGDDPNREVRKMAYFGWEDDVQDQTYTPWKPIHMASLWGFDASRVPVAECLAKHGADLNAVSPLDGFRPIHLVAMPNRVDMIRFYVANGVDVDSRTEKSDGFATSEEDAGPIPPSVDNTPLMVACAEGFIEATECLIELGADVQARNSLGMTPLHFAAKRCWNGQPYDAIIETLSKHGANVSAVDDAGDAATL